MTGRSVLAIVPARGGSKRIPRKNLAILRGRSLVERAVHTCRDAARVTQVVVSTDDDDIASTASRAGAQIVRRPDVLSSDAVPTEPVLLDALASVEATRGAPIDAVVLVQATCPLLRARSVDLAVAKLFDTRCDSVVALARLPLAHFSGELDGDRFLPRFDPRRRPRTQDLPSVYRESGALWVVRRDYLVEHTCRMGGDLRAIVLDDDEAIDIDEPADLSLAAAILAARRPSLPAPRPTHRPTSIFPA